MLASWARCHTIKKRNVMEYAILVSLWVESLTSSRTFHKNQWGSEYFEWERIISKEIICDISVNVYQREYSPIRKKDEQKCAAVYQMVFTSRNSWKDGLPSGVENEKVTTTGRKTQCHITFQINDRKKSSLFGPCCRQSTWPYFAKFEWLI